jgi:hypothetical protein
MDGPGALHYVQRRLAEFGLAVESERETELYDYLTEGRDELIKVFAEAAPIVVRQTVSLEPDAADTRLFNFPAATKDPYRVIRVYDSGTGESLTPSDQLNFDGGHYTWDSLRALRLGDFVSPTGTIRVEAVLDASPITAATTDTAADWGLPTTCHRAACKWAAVLALTADEESDATAAMGLFQREITHLENLYGAYDSAGGLALREAFMRSIGEQFGDTLY